MPRPGPRTTYKYSERFKSTAVALSQLPGVDVQDVADSLCIHPFMLSRWRKQAREGLWPKVLTLIRMWRLNSKVPGDLGLGALI